MERIEFVGYVCVPIRVKAILKENMGIEDIEICLDGDEDTLAVDLQSLKNSILENRNDEFVEDAWDHR